MGRIDATLIPPPHTASMLIKHICQREQRAFISDDIDVCKAELYKSIVSPRPYIPQESISLLSAARPGSNPREPVILIVAYYTRDGQSLKLYDYCRALTYSVLELDCF